MLSVPGYIVTDALKMLYLRPSDVKYIYRFYSRLRVINGIEDTAELIPMHFGFETKDVY